MVKAVKASNSSASEGQENTIPLQKKNHHHHLQTSLLQSVLWSLTLHSKNFSLKNYINKPREKKILLQKKSTKEECTFPIETNVRVPSIYISLCTIVGYLIKHLKYQISHHSTI